MRTTIDLIIPAFNESPNIDPLFEELRDARDDGTIRRVILADNNSTDDTPQRAERHGAIVVQEPQQGYGAACLRALSYLREHDPPDVVVFLDADLSDDPAALPHLLDPILNGNAELVIGSRVRHAEPGALNVVQRFGNGLACTMMRIFAGHRYSDLGPFRAITWPALERLDMQDRTWGWTVEMQMKAAQIGLSISEVDVPYRRRRHGRSKISGTIRGVLKAGTKIILTILKLWIRPLRG